MEEIKSIVQEFTDLEVTSKNGVETLKALVKKVYKYNEFKTNDFVYLYNESLSNIEKNLEEIDILDSIYMIDKLFLFNRQSAPVLSFFPILKVLVNNIYSKIIDELSREDNLKEKLLQLSKFYFYGLSLQNYRELGLLSNEKSNTGWSRKKKDSEILDSILNRLTAILHHLQMDKFSSMLDEDIRINITLGIANLEEIKNGIKEDTSINNDKYSQNPLNSNLGDQSAQNNYDFMSNLNESQCEAKLSKSNSIVCTENFSIKSKKKKLDVVTEVPILNNNLNNISHISSNLSMTSSFMSTTNNKLYEQPAGLSFSSIFKKEGEERVKPGIGIKNLKKKNANGESTSGSNNMNKNIDISEQPDGSFQKDEDSIEKSGDISYEKLNETAKTHPQHANSLLGKIDAIENDLNLTDLKYPKNIKGIILNDKDDKEKKSSVVKSIIPKKKVKICFRYPRLDKYNFFTKDTFTKKYLSDPQNRIDPSVLYNNLCRIGIDNCIQKAELKNYDVNNLEIELFLKKFNELLEQHALEIDYIGSYFLGLYFPLSKSNRSHLNFLIKHKEGKRGPNKLTSNDLKLHYHSFKDEYKEDYCLETQDFFSDGSMSFQLSKIEKCDRSNQVMCLAFHFKEAYFLTTEYIEEFQLLDKFSYNKSYYSLFKFIHYFYQEIFIEKLGLIETRFELTCLIMAYFKDIGIICKKDEKNEGVLKRDYEDVEVKDSKANNVLDFTVVQKTGYLYPINKVLLKREEELYESLFGSHLIEFYRTVLNILEFYKNSRMLEKNKEFLLTKGYDRLKESYFYLEDPNYLFNLLFLKAKFTNLDKMAKLIKSTIYFFYAMIENIKEFDNINEIQTTCIKKDK